MNIIQHDLEKYETVTVYKVRTEKQALEFLRAKTLGHHGFIGSDRITSEGIDDEAGYFNKIVNAKTLQQLCHLNCQVQLGDGTYRWEYEVAK